MQSFLQFEVPPELPLPPLDLMLVDDDFFQILEQTKTELNLIATPGVMAMIAKPKH